MTILAAAHAVSSSSVVPGVLGFLVVAGMGVALYFLFRSLNTHLRKVAQPHPASAQAAAAAKTAKAGKAEAGPGGRADQTPPPAG